MDELESKVADLTSKAEANKQVKELAERLRGELNGLKESLVKVTEKVEQLSAKQTEQTTNGPIHDDIASLRRDLSAVKAEQQSQEPNGELEELENLKKELAAVKINQQSREAELNEELAEIREEMNKLYKHLQQTQSQGGTLNVRPGGYHPALPRSISQEDIRGWEKHRKLPKDPK